MQYMARRVININATLYFLSIWELQLPSDMPDIEDIPRERNENQLDEAQVQMYRDDMN